MEGADPCKIACTGGDDAERWKPDRPGSLPGVSAPFRHRMRVRWPECDMQGIVFYGHYLAYFDLAITELFREAIGPWGTLLDEHDADLVVGEVNLRYRASARFDDELDLLVTVVNLGTTSMTSRLVIERDGELLVEGTLRHVCVDPETKTKRELPAFVRARMEPYRLLDGSEPRPEAAPGHVVRRDAGG